MERGMLTGQSTPTELEPFVNFLRAHAAVVRELSSELVAAHGLTINDYEVLLRLSRAEGSRMRRVDLAQEVLLTPSGITRLLEGLERSGFVERVACKEDLRVSYAQLTSAGRTKLRAASKTHIMIAADGELRQHYLMKAYDAARKAGFEKIHFVPPPVLNAKLK